MSRTDPKSYFVKSFGCQMNVYDGERMAELLGRGGDWASDQVAQYEQVTRQYLLAE